MNEENFTGKWEKRWNPLRKEWVVYAAHRNSRPWNGALAEDKTKQIPSYDPNCYLCPGNSRISGQRNPEYDNVYIFDNDHPVVGINAPEAPKIDNSKIYIKEKAYGVARVVCYDPHHNLTMSEIPKERVTKVFKAWQEQMIDLKKNDKIKYVLIFENKGEAVGVSNPHPHCQIYATDFIFNFIEKELHVAEEYKNKTGKNIFEEIIQEEKRAQVRVIAENENAIAFIPFFARYAYETMIFPKKRHATLTTLTNEELHDMASVFQEVTKRFDMNYNMSFPYVMTFLQAPIDKEYNDYHLHMHILPPLRQPGLIKYLAGPEIGGGNFMADTIPEEKAAELKKWNIES